MDKNRGPASTWFNEVPADDVIHGTIAGLRRLGELPEEQRQRFFTQVGNDPSAQKVLDQLKTGALT